MNAVLVLFLVFKVLINKIELVHVVCCPLEAGFIDESKRDIM